MRKLYYAYDMKDNEVVAFVGNIYEMAKWLGTSIDVVRCNVSRNTLAKRRYLIVSEEI